jgi:hypothetical protein
MEHTVALACALSFIDLGSCGVYTSFVMCILLVWGVYGGMGAWGDEGHVAMGVGRGGGRPVGMPSTLAFMMMRFRSFTCTLFRIKLRP